MVAEGQQPLVRKGGKTEGKGKEGGEGFFKPFENSILRHYFSSHAWRPVS